MKNQKKLFTILIGLVFILTTVPVVGTTILESEKEIEQSSKEFTIYCGFVKIYGEQGGFFYVHVNPYYNYNINVGDEGAELTLTVDYVMDCRHYMDDGYAEIRLLGTNKTDSATTGEFENGTLEITHFFNPDERFILEIFAKYTWWYGWILKESVTDWSFGSTLPVGGDPPQEPEIELTPSSADFGTVLVGQQSEPKLFKLENVGTGTAEGIVYIDGTQDFIITSGEGEFSLEPGDFQDINVIFCPITGNYKGSDLIALGYNCYNDASYLSGIGKTKAKSRNFRFYFLERLFEHFPLLLKLL